MPRDGSNLYTPPASATATPSTRILSASHNAFVADIVADLNAPRPIIAGGTGASSASAARTALGLEIGTNVAPSGYEVPTGAVLPFAGSSSPTGWALCYGQAISRATYAALFAVIGTTYGVGDGATTFNLPDMRGRAVAGKDNMGGTSADRLTGLSGGVHGDNLGAVGGAETHTLSATQIPAHTHAVSASGTTSSDGAHAHVITLSISDGNDNVSQTGAGVGNTSTPSESGGAHTHTVTVTGTAAANSGGEAHNNIQPTIILNYIIKT